MYQLPVMQATRTKICGSVHMINKETKEYEQSTEKRTIYCSQEPDPTVQPDLADDLWPEMTQSTDEDGLFCFTVRKGMWRITADLLPAEAESGATFGYSQDRGEIVWV